MESKDSGDLHLDQVQRRNTDHQVSSSVEGEKMKIERSEAEADREMCDTQESEWAD